MGRLREVRPDSAAERVLALLVRRGPLTVAELVAALGVTPTAVTVQLAALLRGGFVQRTARRGRLGRPALEYAVTVGGRRALAGDAGGVGRSLLEAIFEVEKPARARAILLAAGRRLARSVRGRLTGGRPADRMAGLTALMAESGRVADGRATARRLELKVYTCPYPGLAEAHRDVCEMERAMVSGVLGRPVELSRCMLDGHACCDFEAKVK